VTMNATRNMNATENTGCVPGDVPPIGETCRACRETLSSVSHDIKSAVGIVAGYLDILLNDKMGPLTDRQLSFLHEMRDSTARLQQFTKDFLTFWSLASPSVKLDIQMGDFHACLREISQFWAPVFERKGIAYYFLDNTALEPFAFDYCKIQHVLSNLLDNALKFTPQGGTVWMEAEPQLWERRISTRPSPEERRKRTQPTNAVKVSVSDTGPGIEPEFHQEIFEDRRQLRHIHEPRDAGTGLGLAIARRLVELHHGKIWVESTVGNGSTFSLLLPITEPAEPDLLSA
jgi:signal transduction histidine kinase